MSGYVDLHAHVLPGIDDGPPDMEGAVALARAAVQAGTTTIAATPHLRSDFPDVRVDEIADRCQEVRDALEREEIPLRLVSGAEVSLSWSLDATDEELRLASYDQRGADLLIETPFSNIIGVDRLLYEFRASGYRITLAHPERNNQLAGDRNRVKNLVEMGVLLQVNADSLGGSAARSGPRKYARWLCTEGMAHVVASDGHRASQWRPVTELAKGVGAAAGLVGPERARWMSSDAPAAIVEGDPLPNPPEIVPQHRLWRRFGRS